MTNHYSFMVVRPWPLFLHASMIMDIALPWWHVYGNCSSMIAWLLPLFFYDSMYMVIVLPLWHVYGHFSFMMAIGIWALFFHDGMTMASVLPCWHDYGHCSSMILHASPWCLRYTDLVFWQAGQWECTNERWWKLEWSSLINIEGQLVLIKYLINVPTFWLAE